MEVGVEKGFVHAHVLITIQHRTTNKLRTDFMSRYYYLKYDKSFYVSPPQLKPARDVDYVRYSEKSMKRMPQLQVLGSLTDAERERKTVSLKVLGGYAIRNEKNDTGPNLLNLAYTFGELGDTSALLTSSFIIQS